MIRAKDFSPGLVLRASVLISIFLSALVVMQDDMPNNDGVLYLYGADLILAGEWDKALQLFNWPFYSMLLAAVGWITGLETELVAHMVNALFHGLLVYAFLKATIELGADRGVLLVAAAFILVFPNLNEYRSEIVRDHGYWAISMLALVWLMRCVRDFRTSRLLAGLAALAVAALFRIEGFVLLAAAPLVLVFSEKLSRATRTKLIAKTYLAFAVVALVGVIALGLVGDDADRLKFFYKPIEIAEGVYSALLTDFSARVGILQDHFLIRYSDHYAAVIVIAAFLIILITEISASIGLLVGVFAAYALFADTGKIRRAPKRTVVLFASVYLLMLFLFVIMLGFLTGRYPMALSLLVLLFAPFGAVALYKRYLSADSDHPKRSLWANGVIALLFVYYAVDGIFSFSAGKAHQADAAEWMRQHLTETDRVFSRDAPLLYRSGKLDWERYLLTRVGLQGGGNLRLLKKEPLADVLSKSDWNRYDYVAALVSRKSVGGQDEIEKLIGAGPIKEFRNRKGDRALIYEVRH